MENRELLKELDEKFKILKNELGFKSSLDELDRIFFVRDSILHSRFVSANLSRQICSRIIDNFNSWVNYLHNLVFPNPGFLISMNESKMIGEAGRKSASELISQLMIFVNTNTLIGLTMDRQMEAKFIDDSVEFWNNSFKPRAMELLKELAKGWKESKQ